MGKSQRTNRLTFRLTPEEKALLHSAAASARLTESSYIRLLLANNEANVTRINIDGARLDGIMHELKKSGTNLNQLAHRTNRGTSIPREELVATLHAHRAVVGKLSGFIDETRVMP